MGWRNDCLGQYAQAWRNVFHFHPQLDGHEAITELRTLGVKGLEFRRGRTADGEYFTELAHVIAQKNTTVDVSWVKRVRDLCEACGPAIDIEMLEVAGPNEDDPDSGYLDLVQDGDLMLWVQIQFEPELRIYGDVRFPASEFVSSSPGE